MRSPRECYFKRLDYMHIPVIAILGERVYCGKGSGIDETFF